MNGIGEGCGLVRMPVLNAEVLNTIFRGVEVFSARDMNATFHIANFGDVRITRAAHASNNCRSRRLRRHMSDGTNAYHYACLPISGQVGIEHLGRSCVLTAGTMCLVSTDYEYFIEMSDELDAYWLRLPSHALPGHAASVHEMLCRKLDVSAGIGYAARELISSSLIVANQLNQRSGRLVSQALIGFLEETIEAHFPVCNASAATTHRRKLFARARDYIEDNLGDEMLSPEMIAEGIGISKRYLSQIFAAEGSSVMRWVQKRRLEVCKAEMERVGVTHLTIQEIAYSKGFANISSFNRAFKLHYGCPPTQICERRSRGTAKSMS